VVGRANSHNVLEQANEQKRIPAVHFIRHAFTQSSEQREGKKIKKNEIKRNTLSFSLSLFNSSLCYALFSELPFNMNLYRNLLEEGKER
jgi:hypothetical protein